MNPIKAIVIDDSPSAISDLCGKLKGNLFIEICGCANSFCDSVKMIKEKRPQLLFLDIEMPGKNGFDLVTWLKDSQAQMPYIIFVTGYNSFVLKAFREGALDYLIKPVNGEDLENAIDRACKVIEKDTHYQKLDAFLNYIDGNKQLFLPSATGFCSVNANDIIYVWRNTQTERVEIVFGESEKLILPANYSLSKLLESLPQTSFYLVKPGTVINLRYVKEIQTYDGDCMLQKGDFIVKIQMSRRKLKEFRNQMGL
ncbi:MAG: LytR/AlgR family response regulator transcription factor [Mangrovibacterium sp.]